MFTSPTPSVWSVVVKTILRKVGEPLVFRSVVWYNGCMQNASPTAGWPVLEALRKSHPTPCFEVVELTHKHTHEVFSGAPDGWAEARGATHTLYCGEGHLRGTRPAKLGKTVLWVGVDETSTADGTDSKIVWEKWDIRIKRHGA